MSDQPKSEIRRGEPTSEWTPELLSRLFNAECSPEEAIERICALHNAAVVEEREKVHTCAKCGGSHNFDTSVDNAQWNDVIRAKGLPDYLCLACICSAFAAARRPFTARLYGSGFSGETINFKVGHYHGIKAAGLTTRI